MGAGRFDILVASANGRSVPGAIGAAAAGRLRPRPCDQRPHGLGRRADTGETARRPLREAGVLGRNRIGGGRRGAAAAPLASSASTFKYVSPGVIRGGDGLVGQPVCGRPRPGRRSRRCSAARRRQAGSPARHLAAVGDQQDLEGVTDSFAARGLLRQAEGTASTTVRPQLQAGGGRFQDPAGFRDPASPGVKAAWAKRHGGGGCSLSNSPGAARLGVGGESPVVLVARRAGRSPARRQRRPHDLVRA